MAAAEVARHSSRIINYTLLALGKTEFNSVYYKVNPPRSRHLGTASRLDLLRADVDLMP